MCAIRTLPQSPTTEWHTFSLLAGPINIQGKTTFSVLPGVKTRSAVKKTVSLIHFPPKNHTG